MNLLENFRIFLISQKSSSSTVKNYVADVNHFFSWIYKSTGIRHQIAGKSIFAIFTRETLTEYQLSLATANIPPSTINRHLSALRKLGRFAKIQGWILENPAERIINFRPEKNILKNFQTFLEKERVSAVTVKNYLSDVRHFLNWLEAA